MTRTTTYSLPMQQDVADFHDAFGHPNRVGNPGPVSPSRTALRASLIREEGVVELREAAEKNDPVLVIDALIDTTYVALGALVEMGHDAGELANIDDGVPRAYDANRLLAMAAAGSNTNDMFLTILDRAFRRHDTARAAEILTAIASGSLTNLLLAGIDPQPFFDEVQRANMSKLGADGKPVISRGIRLDGFPKGKVLKGAGYVAPDLASIFQKLYVTPLESYVSPEFERGARAAAEAMRLHLVESPRVPDTNEISARLKALEANAVEVAIQEERQRAVENAA